MKKDQCRSCNAEVIFVPNAKSDKSMILDAEPKKGVVLVEGHREILFPDIRLIARGELSDFNVHAQVIDVYTDHHATCPDANAWKGKRR